MDLPLWARVGGAAAVAAVVAFTSTPVAIATARRYAFYDVPGAHKGHGTPTPYLGGAALMLAFVLGLAFGAGHPTWTLPLVGGILVLLVVGTIDDRRTVAPGTRVAIELALGAVLSVAGLGWKLGAGAAVDAAATAVWVAAVVNACNLFDNMDGAASAMALVVAGGACTLALVTGNAWAAAGSAALCGACLGFLPHNLASRARIFLGDGGSMPLGFVVAVLVASAARSAEASSLSLLVGILLVGLPVLDTCLVIVSRRRRGISVLTGGHDHLTHRTRSRMGTAWRVVLVLGSVQAVVSALVIFASRQGDAALVYVLLGFIVCAAAAIAAWRGGWSRRRRRAVTRLAQRDAALSPARERRSHSGPSPSPPPPCSGLVPPSARCSAASMTPAYGCPSDSCSRSPRRRSRSRGRRARRHRCCSPSARSQGSGSSRCCRGAGRLLSRRAFPRRTCG